MPVRRLRNRGRSLSLACRFQTKSSKKLWETPTFFWGVFAGESFEDMFYIMFDDCWSFWVKFGCPGEQSGRHFGIRAPIWTQRGGSYGPRCQKQKNIRKCYSMLGPLVSNSSTSVHLLMCLFSVFFVGSLFEGKCCSPRGGGHAIRPCLCMFRQGRPLLPWLCFGLHFELFREASGFNFRVFVRVCFER